MRLVTQHDTSHGITLTITSVCGTYYVCADVMDTIYDLKVFLCPHLNRPYHAHPDEQSYYSPQYRCIMTDELDIGMLVMMPTLRLHLSNPAPRADYIPQRCLVILPADGSYERILSIHRQLDIQYLSFLADWIQHDRLLSRIILDADHPQINWIVRKITHAVATYGACLRQIIFSVTDTSLLQWDTLHDLYTHTITPIFLEAHVMKNPHETIYHGESEQKLSQLHITHYQTQMPKHGLTLLQPSLFMKEHPTEHDMATDADILSYDDPLL